MRTGRPDWLDTPFGRFVRFFGGIRFAVPVMLLVAAALAWGTWIESTQGASLAGRMVYGSWWFIGLMSMICVSLIFAVATRYPWQKKHIGFMVVHASLVAIIAVGFFTYFTKIEGQLVLDEGQKSALMRLDDRQLELIDHQDGQMGATETVAVELGTERVDLGGMSLRITEWWPNVTQQIVVTNDGANPLHAVEVEIEGVTSEPTWIGQSAPGTAPPVLGGLAIRVMPPEQAWEPAPAGPAMVVLRSNDGHRHELPVEGSTIHDSGWTVTKVEFFKHAAVDAAGLEEGGADRDNPAVQVMLTHTDGSIERHSAFERFPGSPMKKLVEGETPSPFMINYEGGGDGHNHPTLAITVIEGTLGATFTGSDGQSKAFDAPAGFPWVIEIGSGKVTVHKDYANARGTNEFVKAPEASENLPAIVVAYDNAGTEAHTTLVWGQPTPLTVGDEIKMVRFAPKILKLPFELELIDFRKVDYPGSQMAMAYESDVIMRAGEAAPVEQTIWMNHPLLYDGWKVYQSGFTGSSTSMFQVTKDPGLWPMYISCIGLCLGILIHFYSRSLSSGHPGVPAIFESPVDSTDETTRKQDDVAIDGRSAAGSAGTDADGLGPAATSNRLASQVRDDRDPGRTGADDASGLLRKTDRGRSDRTGKLVG